MPEKTIPTTELTSHYIAQVAGDLESNTKEQERLGAEITALREQLLALQHDHTVLLTMQQALGTTGASLQPSPAQPAPEDTAAPSVPRQKAAPTETADGKRPRVKRAATAQGGRTRKEAPKKAAAKKPAVKAEATEAARPTLVELIRRHLAEQREPRSAAEIATSLGQAHADRLVKTTVVRTSLEGLVAKSQAQRTKQGASVFYTAPDGPESTAPPKAETQSEQSERFEQSERSDL